MGGPKGFVLSCMPFVGRSLTKSKPKIQGFALTDRWSAFRLFSTQGENMKKTIFLFLASPFLWFLSSSTIIAQDVAQSDQITQNQQIIQDGISTTGRFDPVTVNASSTSNVSVQFPLSLASKAVTVQPLDGGVVQSADPAISVDGNLSFSFQVSDRPGVYRVVVIDPNADENSPHIIALVQLEVPSP